ncbi:MAG TPA: hypothetical protein VLZ78_04355, partial [Terrimesophilobacter sp.]|nr:hypothetical protein [Terrimesophilobacter sp.]
MTAAPVEAKPEAPFVPPGMPQPTVDPAAYTDDAPEFSPAVKAILATPVDPELVELRRVKEGSDVELLYVPWIQYQDVLFRAFGPGGWRLVPRGPARTQGTVMTWKGALFVRAPGQTRFQFIKEADGECNLQGGRMTPGNAAEGAQSDCLTKCCKGLHIFMELFDPRWRRAWEAKYKAKHKQQERAAQWPAARAGAQGAGGGGESATSSSARAPSPAPSSSSAAAPAAGPAPSDPTDTGEAASAESKGAIA